MAIDRDTFRHIERMIKPLVTRVANTIARSVVQLADDGKKLQLLQLGVLFGETVDGAEHHQPYGFSSVPLAGAEAIVVFPNGDRSHPLVIATSDRRYRPIGARPGEVTIYNNAGASATFTKDGDVRLKPAAGRQVIIDDGSGAAAVPSMADFTALISILNGAGTGAATAIPAAIAAYLSLHPTWPVGTTTLKAK